MRKQKLLKSMAGAVALGVAVMLPPAGVEAASLDQAKQQGMVCELPTGYLQATGKAGGDVKAMVQDINNKRKAEYTRIANENGVEPRQVGILTAKKLGPKCQ